MSSGPGRRWWPLAAGVLAGIVLAIAVSLLGSTSRKAEAKVLITSPAGTAAVRPLLGNLRELATSGVVAGNVKSTLRLPESAESLRRHLDASVRPGSEVIAITATDASADRARQLAQEAAVVFGQLVEARFGTSTTELHAAGLDSAHVLAGPDRHFLRNGLIGALVGLLLGAAAMFVLAGRRREAPVVVPAGDDRELEERERLLEERLKTVTARERELATRVGKAAARDKESEARSAELAAREQALDDRVAKLAKQERELEQRPAPPPPPPPPPPEPEPEPEPTPEPAPERITRAGAWNVNDLERAVAAQSNASAEQAEEWSTYLFFLREHASSDGALPPQFDGLIEDVFGSIGGLGTRE
ncbi:MAG: YveK family protein [Gaiellaceae bacterium]